MDDHEHRYKVHINQNRACKIIVFILDFKTGQIAHRKLQRLTWFEQHIGQTQILRSKIIKKVTTVLTRIFIHVSEIFSCVAQKTLSYRRVYC